MHEVHVLRLAKIINNQQNTRSQQQLIITKHTPHAVLSTMIIFNHVTLVLSHSACNLEKEMIISICLHAGFNLLEREGWRRNSHPKLSSFKFPPKNCK